MSRGLIHWCHIGLLVRRKASEGKCDMLFLICRFRFHGSYAVTAEQLLESFWYSWGPHHCTDSKRTL